MPPYVLLMRSRTGDMWWGTAIEAPDPGALAAFYSQLLGWPIGHQEAGTAIVAAPQGSIQGLGKVVFQQVRSSLTGLSGVLA